MNREEVIKIVNSIPDNPTNCDVIKALFPYVNVKDSSAIYYSVNIEDLSSDEELNTVGFRKDWMDAPWKGVKQEQTTKNEVEQQESEVNNGEYRRSEGECINNTGKKHGKKVLRDIEYVFNG